MKTNLMWMKIELPSAQEIDEVRLRAWIKEFVRCLNPLLLPGIEEGEKLEISFYPEYQSDDERKDDNGFQKD